MGKTGWKNKRIWCVVIAAALLCVGTGSYLFFHVQAQGILTGLEEKVSQKVKDSKKFQIIEVVPDGSEGEIGYLVKNPKTDLTGEYLKKYLNTYLAEDTSRQNTSQVRKDYVNSLMEQLDAFSGNGKPLQKEGNYEEAYFPKDAENWKVMEFPKEQYETQQLHGSYEEAPALDGNYEPNITGFQYDKDSGAYTVNFTETMRTDTTDAVYTQAYRNVGTDENGNPMMEAAGENPTGTLYYIDSFTYVGSGSAGACYTPVLDTALPYSYIGTSGSYQFVEDEAKEECTVQIGKIYYKGGFSSQDWMRTKVLASKDSDSLEIEVITVEESQLAQTDFSSADFIYICGDTTKSSKAYQNPQAVWDAVANSVSLQKVPCMIDASSGVWEKCAAYQEGYTGQNDFIHENVCIFGAKDAASREPLFENLEGVISDTSGCSEVSELIKKENMIRSGEEKLSTDITRLFLMQYIIDFSNQRRIQTKDHFRVLEIQPTDAVAADMKGFRLTKEKIAAWAGVSADAADITIDSMSTAEFIGKVEDLNKDYDMIYVGACIDYLNTKGSGSSRYTVYNDTRMNGLIYTHTGDYITGNLCISGMMDVDYGGAYLFRNNTPRPYARYADDNWGHEGLLLHNNGGIYTALRNRTKIENDVLRQYFKKPYTQTQYAYGIGASPKELTGDLLSFRYSGNDITKTKLKDLLEYVSANYPVVVSDALYHTDKSVNQDAVDNTSYLYQFLEQIKGNQNVFTVSQAENVGSGIGDYLNIPKPQILYFDISAPETLSSYDGIGTASGQVFSDVSKMIVDTSNAQSEGTYTVKVGFYLESQVEASAASVYRPVFCLDMNADGKFSKAGASGSGEEMSCTIYNADTGEEASKDGEGNYQLNSRVRYRLERQIPATYRGVLSWQLELVQVSNPGVRTSDIQYTKVDGIGEQEVVNVLQITSQSASGADNNRINLKQEKQIQDYLDEVCNMTGLKFDIDTIGGRDYGNNASSISTAEEFYKKKLTGLGKSLEDYDMLIIGFASEYYDLYNSSNRKSQYAVDAINLFIDSGKSVLFSNDTTSFVNVSPHHSFKDGHLTSFSDDWEVPRQWGYYMNNAFRNVMAMDRYGVSADTDTTESAQMQAQGNLLRQQQHLTVDTQTLHATVNQGWVCEYSAVGIGKYEDGYKSKKLGYFLTRNMKEGTLSENRDIAYAPKTYNSSTKQAQALGQTHGFTNAVLNHYQTINQNYLGEFHKEGSNHVQYLNLRNDLLPKVDNSQSDDRLRLQYRDGKVCAKVTRENDGLITHYPYEIGTEFRSAKTNYQYYQLNMDQDADGDGNGDVVVWYCLSGDADNPDSERGKVYKNTKNDARNNYYIYSIGNVTYSGMGNSELDHSGDDLETKLFVNTVVAAYKAGVEAPDVKILEAPDKNAAEKKYEYITYDSSLSDKPIEDDIVFYFTVSDPNLASSEKQMTMEFSYYNGSTNVVLGADQIQVTDMTTNTAASGAYTEGHIYKAVLHGASAKLAEAGNESLEIRAKLNCKFNYYGKEESHDDVSTLKVLKTTLFDLN